MKVLVAGGTGAIGRPLCAQLIAAGHHVSTICRTVSRAAELQNEGVTVHVADALKASDINRVVMEVCPDAIVNQLTALPKRPTGRAMRQSVKTTNELRRSASRHLAQAARLCGVKRLISQSIAFYCEPGLGLADEKTPLIHGASESLQAAVDAVLVCEAQTLEHPAGAILRYGFLYGPGTWYAEDGAFTEMLIKRKLPIIWKWSRGIFDDSCRRRGTSRYVDPEARRKRYIQHRRR